MLPFRLATVPFLDGASQVGSLGPLHSPVTAMRTAVPNAQKLNFTPSQTVTPNRSCTRRLAKLELRNRARGAVVEPTCLDRWGHGWPGPRSGYEPTWTYSRRVQAGWLCNGVSVEQHLPLSGIRPKKSPVTDEASDIRL